MFDNTRILGGNPNEYKTRTDYKTRIIRSGLSIDKDQKFEAPAIRFVECSSELEKNFSLVYRTYMEKGFIPNHKSNEMSFSIYSLLPETTHISVRKNRETISNLTKITDTREFGLPMDDIYKPELNRIRKKGRKIVELSALATPAKFRWRNIFLHQIQAVYWYALYQGVDDICLVVNPRHKKYYTCMFPCEELGPVRHYSRVNAPAVGLRARVYEALDSMMKISSHLSSGIPFYKRLHQAAQNVFKPGHRFGPAPGLQLLLQPNMLNARSVRHFIKLDPKIIEGINAFQKKMLERAYPGLSLA